MIKDVFGKLRALQDVLSKKYEIEKEIFEIPKNLSVKNELLNRLKKTYIAKNNSIEQLKERIKHLQFQLSDMETQRETYEKQMDEISTQREYEALDKEIKSSSDKEQQYRKDIVNEEKELDEMISSLEREEKMISMQEDELKSEQNKITIESEAKRKELEILKDEESSIVPGLDDDILFKFERIIKNKAGLGIVPVNDSVCTGCHMILPAQFENDIRKGEKILFCPYCSRILFYGENEEASMLFNENDAGSLADLADLD